MGLDPTPLQSGQWDDSSYSQKCYGFSRMQTDECVILGGSVSAKYRTRQQRLAVMQLVTTTVVIASCDSLDHIKVMLEKSKVTVHV